MLPHEKKTQVVMLYKKKYADFYPKLFEIMEASKEMLEIMSSKNDTPEDFKKLNECARKLSNAVENFNKMLENEMQKTGANASGSEKRLIENEIRTRLEKNDSSQDVDIEHLFNIGASHTFNNINNALLLCAMLSHNPEKHEKHTKIIKTAINRTKAVADLLQNADESKVITKKYIPRKDAPIYFVLEPETVN